VSDIGTLSKSMMPHESIGQSVFGGAFTTPLMFLKDTAISNNLERMSRYVQDRDVSIAPHVKTAMAPVLFTRQLDAGAWALTAATVSQARVLHEHGVKRILLANQLVNPAAIRWVANKLANSRFEFMCFIDSVSGVRILDQVGEGVTFDVLLEVGAFGARTGVRRLNEALAVATAITESKSVRLVGVAGYEGSIAGRANDKGLVVREYLENIKGVAVRLSELGFFDGLEEVVITAGGSMYFDYVVRLRLPRDWFCGVARTSRMTRVVTSAPPRLRTG